MNIYDKIVKILSHREQVLFEYLGKNIIRIENRYKNSFLVKRFGKEFTDESLFIPNTFLMLIYLFTDDYNLIFKENKYIIDFSKIHSKKDLLEQLANEEIKAMGGVSEIIELIDASMKL